MSHHLLSLRVCISRKLGAGAEPGLEARHCYMECRHLKCCLCHCAKNNPLFFLLSKICSFILKGRRRRKGGRERENISHPVVHFSSGTSASEVWARPKPEGGTPPGLDSPMSGRSKYLGPSSAVSRNMSRKLDQKPSSWDLRYGIPHGGLPTVPHA